MFTGIIEETGRVVESIRKGTGVIAGIKAAKIFDDLQIGDSISVDGVCLTVENIKNQIFYASLSPETIRLTTLGNLRPGMFVNLERALKYGARIGGHLLSGHVDFKTRIISKKDTGDASLITVKIPQQYSGFFIKKGSVGIDGISLTVADITDTSVIIWLIPHTIENTTMKNKKTGDLVNVEIDMMVKVLIESKPDIHKKNGKINKEAIM